MPVMNGFAATRAIRAYEEEQGIESTRIVALTGLGDTVSQQEAFTSGIDVFLTKPVSLGRLKGIIVKGVDG